MDKFEGTCIGGPLDKQRMAWTSKTKKLFRLLPTMNDVESIEIGEYRLNDFEQWMWWPTEKGKAMDVLFGEIHG